MSSSAISLSARSRSRTKSWAFVRHARGVAFSSSHLGEFGLQRLDPGLQRRRSGGHRPVTGRASPCAGQSFRLRTADRDPHAPRPVRDGTARSPLNLASGSPSRGDAPRRRRPRHAPTKAAGASAADLTANGRSLRKGSPHSERHDMIALHLSMARSLVQRLGIRRMCRSLSDPRCADNAGSPRQSSAAGRRSILPPGSAMAALSPQGRVAQLVARDWSR